MMENIAEKAQDDQDFLWSYKSIRTGIPSNKYRENWDRIFNNQSPADRIKNSVDVGASGEQVR